MLTLDYLHCLCSIFPLIFSVTFDFVINLTYQYLQSASLYFSISEDQFVFIALKNQLGMLMILHRDIFFLIGNQEGLFIEIVKAQVH